MKTYWDYCDDLSWDASETEQAEAIEYLITFFAAHCDAMIYVMQTLSDKHLWENQAKVVCGQSDVSLERYIPRMLDWIKDSNWPGADIIWKRLVQMPVDLLMPHILNALRWAKMDDALCWENNLNRLKAEIDTAQGA